MVKTMPATNQTATTFTRRLTSPRMCKHADVTELPKVSVSDFTFSPAVKSIKYGHAPRQKSDVGNN